MKRNLIFLSLATVAIAAHAGDTDWLNFSTGIDGSVVESVFFKNQGRLMFNELEMVYEDDGVVKSIPYTAGAYIFFSETASDGIENIVIENEIALVYSKETQQILIKGVDTASELRIYSVQGALLRASHNVPSISTIGLQPGIIIVTAVCDGHAISKKIIIK